MEAHLAKQGAFKGDCDMMEEKMGNINEVVEAGTQKMLRSSTIYSVIVIVSMAH